MTETLRNWVFLADTWLFETTTATGLIALAFFVGIVAGILFAGIPEKLLDRLRAERADLITIKKAAEAAQKAAEAAKDEAERVRQQVEDKIRLQLDSDAADALMRELWGDD